MAAEYNSLLISRLYAATTTKEVEDTLDEIREEKDLVFVYPVYDAYLRFKTTIIRHIIIGCLNTLESKETLELLKKIATDDSDDLVFSYTTAGLLRYKFFSEEITEKAKLVVLNYSIKNTNIALDYLVQYIEASGHFEDIEDDLKDVFEDKDFDLEDRKIAIGYLLKRDSKKWLQYYIDQYDTFDPDTKILLSKKIQNWEGSLSNKLKDLIVEKGPVRATEVIVKSREAKAKDEKTAKAKEGEKEEVTYSNSALVSAITSTREKVNTASTVHAEIKFPLYNPDDSIFKQMETAKTEEAMVMRMAALRDHIQNINKEVGNHGVSFEQAKLIIPGISEQDFNKSLNQLTLLLHSRKIISDSDLFGFKNINRAVNLFTHAKEQPELIKALAVISLAEEYKSRNWPSLHKGMMEQYLKCFEKLLSALQSP